MVKLKSTQTNSFYIVDSFILIDSFIFVDSYMLLYQSNNRYHLYESLTWALNSFNHPYPLSFIDYENYYWLGYILHFNQIQLINLVSQQYSCTT